MDNSRGPLGPCVMSDCAAPGYAQFAYPSTATLAGLVLCRAHLEQMLIETGLIEKPEYRALREAIEDDR